MEKPRYSLNVLERLCHGDLAGRLPWHVLKDDGLWTKLHDEMPAAERAVVEWHPRQDEEVPALPVPFTANELAAFMLAGGGWLLLEPFEHPEEVRGVEALPAPPWPPLDERALEDLGPNAGRAREALREVHRLLRLSVERFGRDDAGVRSAATWLLSGSNAENGSAAAGVAPIRREARQSMPDNERMVREAIDAELQACGIDTVPPFKRGKKPDPFKAKVHERSGLTDGAFKHAWGAVTKGKRPLKRPRTA